jgi:hypothetical protein
VSLIEVIVAFTILMVALLPLSYLFTTSLIQAGQSTNQQTALSIAEKWVEVLSNSTPPANAVTGGVAVNVSAPPAGPAPTFAPVALGSLSLNHNISAVTKVYVSSVAIFAVATAAVPQTAFVNIDGTDYQITYTSQAGGANPYLQCPSNCSPSSATMDSGTTVDQEEVAKGSELRGNTTYALSAKYNFETVQGNGSAPNLCTSGTPQLLNVAVSVSWGPNADVNNVQDSVMINYPPSGVQTLGFLALQLSGDTLATDSQPDPWSTRVTAIPVTIYSGGQPYLSVYPDQYGCVFVQVPQGTYTVGVGQPVANVPAGTNYGSPVFVANAAGSTSAPAGTYTANVWTPPVAEPYGSLSNPLAVTIGTVTRVQSLDPTNYPPFDQGASVHLSYPSTTAVDDGVTCPGAGQITCLTTGQNASGNAVVNWLSPSTWTSASLPNGTTISRIASTSCTVASGPTNVCIGVGYGTGGAVILQAISGSPPQVSADAVPAGLNTAGSTLTQVSCPSAVSNCVAIGRTGSGTPVVLSGAIGATAGTDVWTSDSLPGNVTSLSNLQCPTGATPPTTGCMAIATTSTANSPILVNGPAAAGSWTAGTFTGFTISALTQVTCPSATQCVAIGTGKIGAGPSGPVVLSGTTGASGLTGTVAWTADSLNTPGVTVNSLSQIVCPSSAKCLFIGQATAGSTTGAFDLYGPPAGPLSAQIPVANALPVSAINQISCPASSGFCTATASQGSTPIIFTVAVQGPATQDTWTSDTIPGGGGTVTSVGQLVCPSATNCVVAGAGPSEPLASLLVTTAANTSGTSGAPWNTVSLPAADNVAGFDGVSCTSGTTCAAVGATPTGAVILSSTNAFSGSWSDGTPTNLTGYTTTGIPVEINSSSLASGIVGSAHNVNAVTYGGSTNALLLPAVFPFSSGYGLWAGDCVPESQSTGSIVQTSTIPGGSSSVTIPLGQLGIQVLHQSGANAGLPYAGLSLLTLTAATAGCSADTYSLQTTDSAGLSRTAVPLGSYNLSVNNVAVGTVTVNAGSVSFGGTTYPLSSLITVSS